MAAIHQQAGLGELPRAPITEYLTRSLSAMYALHGLVLLALSTNVRRHLAVVGWLGWGTAVLGALQLAIDAGARLPAWWTVVEGPWALVAGGLIVWLVRRARGEREGRVMRGVPLKQAE